MGVSMTKVWKPNWNEEECAKEVADYLDAVRNKLASKSGPPEFIETLDRYVGKLDDRIGDGNYKLSKKMFEKVDIVINKINEHYSESDLFTAKEMARLAGAIRKQRWRRRNEKKGPSNKIVTIEITEKQKRRLAAVVIDKNKALTPREAIDYLLDKYDKMKSKSKKRKTKSKLI